MEPEVRSRSIPVTVSHQIRVTSMDAIPTKTSHGCPEQDEERREPRDREGDHETLCTHHQARDQSGEQDDEQQAPLLHEQLGKLPEQNIQRRSCGGAVYIMCRLLGLRHAK